MFEHPTKQDMNRFRILLRKANRVILQGGIIAYPTEAVYGLGCNPFDPNAVARIRTIKHRATGKGLILIAATIEQVIPLITTGPVTQWPAIKDSWPGPVTWIFPASPAAPPWLLASDHSIAIRLTAHPMAANLCLQAGMPLVSTSANTRQQTPALTALSVRCRLGPHIDLILSGPTSGCQQPTTIMDARTGQHLRN